MTVFKVIARMSVGDNTAIVVDGICFIMVWVFWMKTESHMRYYLSVWILGSM